jgi:hypothetical protein
MCGRLKELHWKRGPWFIICLQGSSCPHQPLFKGFFSDRKGEGFTNPHFDSCHGCWGEATGARPWRDIDKLRVPDISGTR